MSSHDSRHVGAAAGCLLSLGSKCISCTALPWSRGTRAHVHTAPLPPLTRHFLCALQGCVLWHNWWPMLTGVMYVLVPMPYLFFRGGNDSYGSELASG